jgi:aminoglycoside 6'-N-acetyltransferase
MTEWQQSRIRPAVTFRLLQRSDLPALAAWLGDAEVQRWWPVLRESDELESEYGPAIDGVSATQVFVIEVDRSSAGIIQRYRTSDYPSWDAALREAVPSLAAISTAGIDYLIGRPDFRNRGIGTTAIGAFTTTLFEDMPDVASVVVSVQQENRSSWRALERAGYERVFAGMLRSDDPSDSGPSYVLIRRR